MEVLFHPMTRLLTGQHGAVSVAQLRAIGVSDDERRALIRSGALCHVCPSVLVDPGSPPTWERRAAVATLAGEGLTLSHGAAGRLHRIPAFATYPYVDVLGPKSCDPQLPREVIVHRTRHPFTADCEVIDGIVVTTLATTLIHIVASEPPALAARAVAEAIADEATRRNIRAAAMTWRRRGRRGPATLIRLLDDPPDVAADQPSTPWSISSAAAHGSIERASTPASSSSQRVPVQISRAR
jgi:hypothetical protein